MLQNMPEQVRVSGHPQLELCATTARCVAVGAAAGVDRIELCAALELGGMSPSPGALEAALVAAGDVPVRVMVRPHSGGFVYERAEIDAMMRDVCHAIAAGAEGVVLGALTEEGGLDCNAMARLIEAAKGHPVTLHRAFDLCPYPSQALAQAIELGVDCILTSGGASSAVEGCAVLERLTKEAGGEIAVMAGGGVRPQTIPGLLRAGVDALHGSFSKRKPQGSKVARIGIPAGVARADQDLVARARAAIPAAQP